MFNRRIGKRVDETGNGSFDSRARYIVSDMNDQVVLDFIDKDSDGNVEGDELSARYLWGQAVDQILAQEDVTNLTTAGDVLWPLTDNLGTVRDLATYDDGTDTTTIAEHIAYDAFGNVTAMEDGSGNAITELSTRFTYTAQEFDSDVDLFYYNERWYDPNVGQFLSPDPIKYDKHNTYRYVDNDPINNADPRGLEKVSIQSILKSAQPELAKLVADKSNVAYVAKAAGEFQQGAVRGFIDGFLDYVELAKGVWNLATQAVQYAKENPMKTGAMLSNPAYAIVEFNKWAVKKAYKAVAGATNQVTPDNVLKARKAAGFTYYGTLQLLSNSFGTTAANSLESGLAGAIGPVAFAGAKQVLHKPDQPELDALLNKVAEVAPEVIKVFAETVANEGVRYNESAEPHFYSTTVKLSRKSGRVESRQRECCRIIREDYVPTIVNCDCGFQTAQRAVRRVTRRAT